MVSKNLLPGMKINKIIIFFLFFLSSPLIFSHNSWAKKNKNQQDETPPPAPEILIKPVAVEPPKRNIDFFFIYPDGEGSPEEAQPLLDSLFALLREKTGYEFTGRYVSNIKTSLEEANKADMAIVSLGFYTAHKKIILMEPALSTQFKETEGMAAYTLIGHKDSSRETIKTVYTSSFIPPSLLKVMLPEMEIKRETTHESIGLLKTIAASPDSTAFLLDPFEYKAYSKLNLPWKENLKIFATTKPLPQAPVVFLKPLTGKRAKIIEALMALGNDEKGQEILSSLRLKGFILADVEAYKKILVQAEAN